MNKFENELNPREQLIQKFLDEFEEWAKINPHKTNVSKDLLSPDQLAELYFSDK